jgi:hypothetical protein
MLLNFYYSVLENKQAKRVNGIMAATGDLGIPAPSATTDRERGTLNLIPVPKKVKFTGSSYTLPGKIIFSVADSLKDEAGKYLKNIFSDEQIY